MPSRKLVVELIGEDSSLQRVFGRTSRSAKTMSSDLSKAERGILSGSGAFRSMGRSLAFASAGFIGFASAASFLRKSVDAAQEAQVANQQLATQLRNNGKTLADYRGQIDQTTNRLSQLAGFNRDELTGSLTTILRTVPNVGKALRDLSTAADLARAKHIGLNQAALVIAKTEAGNTTLLRRQGFQIAKNATAEQALATLRQVVAGQARAGTTEAERFNAVLHNSEEIIGTALLPTLNKYLAVGAKWLTQMNESGKLQKDVSKIAHDLSTAVDDVAGVIKIADRVTGSFKNTLELLLGLKVASIMVGWAKSIGLVGSAATTAEGKVVAMRTNLGALGPLTLAPIVIPVIAQVENRVRNRLGLVGKILTDVATPANAGPDVINAVKKILAGSAKDAYVNAPGYGQNTDVGFRANSVIDLLAKASKDVVGFRSAAITAMLKKAAAGTTVDGKPLTVAQRNTFFDNAVARILMRGGLGSLREQLAALKKADALLRQRLAVTKDATRRAHLTDELLQNAAQERGIAQQMLANKLQAQQAAAQKQQEAAQKLHDRNQATLYAMLGLGPTGQPKVPTVKRLRSELAQLTAQVGDNAQLQKVRKTLGSSLLPSQPEVRSAVQGILDTIRQTFQQGVSAPTFRHTSTKALLAGLGLDEATTRILRQRLSAVGPGGTVPGGKSLAFAGQTPIDNHVHVHLDGREITSTVTKNQQKASTRRTGSRRGPYAGRH